MRLYFGSNYQEAYECQLRHPGARLGSRDDCDSTHYTVDVDERPRPRVNHVTFMIDSESSLETPTFNGGGGSSSLGGSPTAMNLEALAQMRRILQEQLEVPQHLLNPTPSSSSDAADALARMAAAVRSSLDDMMTSSKEALKGEPKPVELPTPVRRRFTFA